MAQGDGESNSQWDGALDVAAALIAHTVHHQDQYKGDERLDQETLHRGDQRRDVVDAKTVLRGFGSDHLTDNTVN